MAIPQAAVTAIGPDVSSVIRRDDPTVALLLIEADLDSLHRSVSLIAEQALTDTEGYDDTAVLAAINSLQATDVTHSSQISTLNAQVIDLLAEPDPGPPFFETVLIECAAPQLKLGDPNLTTFATAGFVDGVLSLDCDFSGTINSLEFRPGATSGGAFRSTSRSVSGSNSSGFEFNEATARTAGPQTLFRSGADGKELFRIGHWSQSDLVPGVVSGYATTLAGYGGTLLSFAATDSTTGKTVLGGLVGSVVHDDGGITASRLGGVAGAVGLTTYTNLTTNFVMGLSGVAAASSDTNTVTNKTIAGVVGRLSGGALSLEAIFPSSPNTQPQQELVGNWAHASCFWADSLPAVYYADTTVPTNLPAILTSYKATIPEATDGEAWAYYCNEIVDTYVTGSPYYYYAPPPDPTVSGVLRAPWPRTGGRKTHIYFIPGLDTETSGNVVGDVYFDDGTNGPVGLWQHDGTAFRYLLNQINLSTDNGGGAPVFRNLPTGVDATQDAWVLVRVDDGTAAGRDGWMQIWWA